MSSRMYAARSLPWLGTVLVMALAMAARHGLIEPANIAHLCDSGAGPWWCAVRRGVILAFAYHVLGYTALAAGILATVSRSTAAAVMAALCGGAGLVLYEFEYSAVGFLLGTLVLARNQTAPSRQQDGGRERQA